MRKENYSPVEKVINFSAVVLYSLAVGFAVYTFQNEVKYSPTRSFYPVSLSDLVKVIEKN